MVNYPKTYTPCSQCVFHGVSTRAMCECCELELLRIKAAKKQSEGEWIEKPRPYEDEIECSVCGANFNMLDNCTEKFDYCPNCGAKMTATDTNVGNKSEWISVDERLPDKQCEVLAYYGFIQEEDSHTVTDLGYMAMGVLTYFANALNPHWQHESVGLRVTHWMPLPEEPKGGDE